MKELQSVLLMLVGCSGIVFDQVLIPKPTLDKKYFSPQLSYFEISSCFYNNPCLLPQFSE